MSYFPTSALQRSELADAAAAAVPNRLAIAEQTNREHPRLLRWNTPAACAEYLQRTRAAMPPADRFGFLTKSDGEAGYTLPNGHRIALDVLALPDGNRIDIISGSNNHPLPAGPSWQVIPPEHWRPSNVYIDGSAWPIFDSGTPGGAQPAKPLVCGMGAFPLLRALAEWGDEMQTNARFIRERLPVKVWRCFLDVEGISHIRGTMPDPWRDAGIDGRASNWSDRFKAALDFAGNAGEQLWCCVYGGRNHFPEAHSRRVFHDRIVQAAQGRWSAIWGFEMMNEYLVNRWELREVQDAGADLRSKIPAGTRLALSSPCLAHALTPDDREATNEEMAAAVNDVAGHGASVLTIHKMRDARSKWADAFAYNGYRPDLPKIDGEPFGDGASAGGDTSDPRLIAADAQRTRDAGYALRIEHPASFCIWMARIPSEYGLRQYRFIKDVPHIEETFRLLQTVYGGGTVQPGQPGVPEMPLPDRGDVMRAIDWLHDFYKAPEGLKRPDGLWKNGRPDTEGIGAWGFDVYLRERQKGKTHDDAIAEVRRQIEASDEWKRKHAA
jgi:hypothetical protein